MIDLTSLWIFVGAVVLLLLSPGPNMAFVISHGISYGWRGGVAAGLGIGLADLLLTALTATGITTLVASWPPSFELIRYAGVLYLLWLAFKTLLHSSAARAASAPLEALPTLLLRAMLNSLLNPKALLFFLGVLAAMVTPQVDGLTRGLLILELFLLSLAWFGLLAWSLSTARAQHLLSRVQRPLNLVTGLLFGAVSLSILVELAGEASAYI